MSKTKKEKKNKPESSVKSTVVSSVAAVICAALVANTVSTATGSMAEANSELAKAEAVKAAQTVENAPAASESSAASGYSAPTDAGISSAPSESSESADTAGSGESTDAEPAQSGGTSTDATSTGNNASGTSAAKPAADKSGVPQTTAEIVNYCNKALNDAKAAKVGYTKKFVRKGGDNLPSVVSSVIAQDKTTTAAKGSDGIKDDFPAAGYSWSSKLREQDVKSAQLKQNGQYYEILIKLDKETNPGKGEASKYGRVMSVIDANDAKNMVPGVKSINMVYHDGYVYAKVDAKTGKLVKAEFSATADISATLAIFGELSANNLVSTETFTDIKW